MTRNVSMKYWKKPQTTGLLSCLCSFFHVSRLKPKYLCWHGLSRVMQVKDAWLAEIPFLEGKSWNECCPAALLILLWDAATDSDSPLTAIACCLAFRTRSPARLCALDNLWGVEPIHLGIVQAARQMPWGKKYLLRCLQTFHFPEALFEGKKSNWAWGKVSEISL